MPTRACLLVAVAVAGVARGGRPDQAGDQATAGAAPPGYAIVVSEGTLGDPAWAEVVSRLESKHAERQPRVIAWRESPAEAAAELAALRPRHACFVARPEEAGRGFVAAVHRLTRSLDQDPFTDVIWGILTGFDAANARAIAETDEPLVIRRVTSGTEVALDRVDEGVWFSELRRNEMVRKEAGGEPREEQGPDDTTAALAARLNDGRTDLFITSGHATERDWQIGFAYPNGHFRSAAGRLEGRDAGGARIPIESTNSKVWLPVGNCLAGHIDGPDALALAFLNAAGVRQMIGYTVPTWFGYAGWGLLDYFVEQPGRFTLCEAFHANDHALVHRLTTRAAPAEERGLLFDRDVVAFYGDPAWEARMAPGKLAFDQRLTEQDGRFTLVITPLDGERSFLPVNTNGSQRGGRPVVAYLPRRIGPVTIIEGGDWKPVVTDDFVLVPLPPADRIEPVTIVFREQAADSGGTELFGPGE